MARLFVRLKLSLLAGGFRRGWQQLVGMIVAAVLLLPSGIALGIGVAVGGRSLEQGGDLVVVVVALAGVFWLLGPPLFFGVDETLDPARLALLPLRRRDLVVGMTAASLVGIGPAITALILLGAVVGSTTSPAGAVIAALAAVVQLAACVLAARAVTTSLSVRLRSRRGRDLAGLLLVLGIITVSQAPNLLLNVFDVGARGITETLRTAARFLGLTPFGWAGAAMAAARDGRLPEAAGWLAATGLLAVALAWWWLRALAVLTTRPEQAGPARRDDEDLFPRVVRWLPRNRLGAGAAREVRYFAREPRYRLAAIIQAGFGIVIVVGSVIAFDRDPRAVLMIAALAFPLSLATLNAFGADSGATWLLVAVGGDHRADLLGKNVGAGLAALPFTLLATVAAAAVTGGWAYVPVALLVLVGAYALACGVGDVISVVAPFAQPELGGNVFGARSGANVVTALLQVLAILVLGVLTAPLAAATIFGALRSPGALLAVAVGAPLYGAALGWLGLTLAARHLSSRGPEVLAALAKGRD